ncbi:MAG: hypothetical protein JXR83_12975 [Deltaproteobacteria bacterium]|nr:hypothetical protein [Deltaproteobacteria bacterium]
MRPGSIRWIASLAAVLLATGCEPAINVALKIIKPCDQADALDPVGSFRFEITGKGTPAKASNFSRSKKSGQIPSLPLGEDIKIAIKGFTGDVEKDPGVIGAAPIASGATQPRDLVAETEQRDYEVAVEVGKVDSFASTTDAEHGDQCTVMSTPRHGHTATYLPKVGKVLIVGGAVLDSTGNENLIGTAELFDPATGEYTELPEPPGGPRIYHAASALPDGRALITGGLSIINNNLSTVATGFVYDPAKSRNPYTLVTMPSTHARAHHTSTLVDTGALVLLVGGCNNTSGTCTRSAANNAIKTTLIFDIAAFDKGTVTLAPGPDLPNSDPGRVFHVALPIANGRVLVAGGSSGGASPSCTLLLFESQQRQFNPDFDDTLSAEACTSHLAGTVLADGRVLLSGGYKTLGADGAPTTNAADFSHSTTIWDASQTSRLQSGPDLLDGRAEHVLFALPPLAGGSVPQALVVGGITTAIATPQAERIDLEAGSATATANRPLSLRIAMGAVVLGSGQPMLLGGIDPSASATGSTVDVGELYHPFNP